MGGLDRILVWMLGAGLLAAGFVAVERHHALTDSRAVEFAVSLAAVRESAVTQAFPAEEILRRYREAGANTLLLRGATLQALIEHGGTGYPAGYQVWLAVEPDPEPEGVRITVRENPALATWLEERLTARLGSGRVARVSAPRTEPVLLRLRGLTAEQALGMTLGLHPADLALAERLGMTVAADLTEEAVPASGRVGAAAPQVLLAGLPFGSPLLTTGAGGLAAMEPGALEQFLQQGRHPLLIDHSRPPFSAGLSPGMAAVASRLEYFVVKVFRVTYQHGIIDVVTAVKERRIRFVLLQPFHLTGDLDRDLAEQAGMWSEVRRRLGTAGFTVGRAQPIGLYRPPLAALLLIGMASGAALALLAEGLPAAIRLAVPIAGTLLAVLPGGWETRGLQGLALLVSTVLPVWAAWRTRSDPHLLRRMMLTAAGAMAAGLLITGLMGDVRFALEFELFRGVKLALVAPTLLWLLLAVWHERTALVRMLPPRLWQVLGLVLGAAALWVMFVRSGQAEQWRLVSTFELQVRALLEQVLVIRPRFKEFLIGWPALALAHGAYGSGHRAAGAVLTGVGLIGPASLINSFAHLHTPVWISVLRGLHGLWLGIAAGAVLLVVARALAGPLLRRWKGVLDAA